MSLPEFTEEGGLPPGDYELAIPEIRESMLVVGPRGNPEHKHWDRQWRGTLVDMLQILVGQLVTVGVTDVFIDGSFVEDKNHPNEIDFPSAFRVSRRDDAQKGIIKIGGLR